MSFTARFQTIVTPHEGTGPTPYASVVSLLRAAHDVRATDTDRPRVSITTADGEFWGYARVSKLVPMRFTLQPAHTLSAHAVAPSAPEPPPQPKGQPVTPQLVAWLGQHGSAQSIELVQARAAFGLGKYGQGLMTGDGRNTFNDISDELGDAQQYAFKALINTDLTSEQVDTLKTYIQDLTAIIDFIDHYATQDEP